MFDTVKNLVCSSRNKHTYNLDSEEDSAMPACIESICVTPIVVFSSKCCNKQCFHSSQIFQYHLELETIPPLDGN